MDELMENGDVSLNKETLSFGEMLKKARMGKNLTIDDIVMETRISKQVIEQIESKEPEILPEPVFLRGFLKSYAEQVGLDPVDIVEMYKAAYGIEDIRPNDAVETVGSVVHVQKTSKLPFFIGLIVIMCIGLIAYSLMYNKTDSGEETQAQAGIEAGTAEGADAQTKAITKEFNLEIVCVEDTALKISTDGNKVIEYNMKPEDHLELKAKKEFNILIDNTCGVTLFLNNTPVDIPGKCGQTVNVMLP